MASAAETSADPGDSPGSEGKDSGEEDPSLAVPDALRTAVERLSALGYHPLDWLDERNRFRVREGSGSSRQVLHTSGQDSSPQSIVSSIHHYASPGRAWSGPGLDSERQVVPLELSGVAVWELALQGEPLDGGWPRRLHLSTWVFDTPSDAAAAEPTLRLHARWVLSTAGAKSPNRLWRSGALLHLARVDAAVLAPDLDRVSEALQAGETR